MPETLAEVLPFGTHVEAVSAEMRTFVHWRGRVVGHAPHKDKYLILTPTQRLVEWTTGCTRRISTPPGAEPRP